MKHEKDKTYSNMSYICHIYLFLICGCSKGAAKLHQQLNRLLFNWVPGLWQLDSGYSGCAVSGTWKSALISTMVFPTFLCLLNAEISLEISQKRLQVQTVTACQSHKVHVALRGGLASESQRFCLDSRRGPCISAGDVPLMSMTCPQDVFFPGT